MCFCEHTGCASTVFYRCVLLSFIVHLLSRVFVLRVSEVFHICIIPSTVITLLQGSLCHAGMGGDPRAAAAKP